MTPSLLVLIPAWNEEQVISGVLAEIMSVVGQGVDVVVISDGSTDATARIARDAGATVLDLPVNLGVGGAMRAGYLYALRHDYDYAVQVDADGQHDPAEIASLLAAARQQDADVVIGARFAGKGDYEVHGPRRWAMAVLSVVLSRVCRTRLSDTTSGFKLTSRRAIALFAREFPAEYLGDTVEALVIAARGGLKVVQVPVEMRPRAGGAPSHNPFKAAKFLLRAFMALGIALTRPRTAPASSSEEMA
ncbi:MULTISPECIES: glycosyltransferase family 2 protein [Actinomyces]|uniref:Glycosyltransferase family 2 protein n=1 Tax=Actinomyces respiraculi TaxID=2744574 RepID=A0A7T0PWV1_9ACTO|nr:MULTISPECIES: glycosyltransferase family 2 protein [Actinomyces]QPL05828.1 glycosyltransferase family 2 protein [Actinomyces respiraculi]